MVDLEAIQKRVTEAKNISAVYVSKRYAEDTSTLIDEIRRLREEIKEPDTSLEEHKDNFRTVIKTAIEALTEKPINWEDPGAQLVSLIEENRKAISKLRATIQIMILPEASTQTPTFQLNKLRKLGAEAIAEKHDKQG